MKLITTVLLLLSLGSIAAVAQDEVTLGTFEYGVTATSIGISNGLAFTAGSQLRGLERGSTVRFNPPNARSVSFEVEKVHLTQRGNLGVVSQISAGKWMRLLIQEDGNFFGTIVADGATYVARAGKDGTAFHSTAEKTVATSPFENDALPVTPIADAEEGTASWSASASPSVVSVGILYDNELASVDQNLLLNWIDELLFAANGAYQSSGVNVEFVAVAATNYEPGATLDMQGELEVVTCGSPGCRVGIDVNNQVIDWRTSVEADLVVQLVGTGSGSSCGLGWVPQPGVSAALARSLAYSVSAVQNSVGSACPSSVLAHEMGHNLGLAHDRTTGGSPLFTYGWGYRLPEGYGTNMAYPERGFGGYVPYLSNPNISIANYRLGEPIGASTEAFAAQAAANTIPTFAATYDNSDLALVPPPPVLESVSTTSSSLSVFFTPKRTLGQPLPTLFTASCSGVVASGSSSPVIVSGLVPGSSYSCTIRSSNQYGISGLSNTVQAVTTSGGDTPEAFVERHYVNTLGRPSDADGLASWVNVMQTQSASAVPVGFLLSAEFVSKGRSDSAFVDILYQTFFNRTASSGETNSWLGQLAQGRLREMVMWDLVRGAEFRRLADGFGVVAVSPAHEAAYGIRAFTERFYTVVLVRYPDPAGFNGWVDALTDGSYSGSDIARGFFLSPEYTNKNKSDSAFLDDCYQAYFNRLADAGGKQGWLDLLAQGTSRTQVLDGFSGSQEFIALAESYGIRPFEVYDVGDGESSAAEAIPTLPVAVLLLLTGLLSLFGFRKLRSV
ncbi:DUF4214 domain-containing protein [Luminiphilus sp.]|nr:DUF4214 domain-containing protein [Luminiphilus sp.]